MSSIPHGRLGALLVLVTVAALGCREAEQIHSYDVPKEPTRVATGKPASAGGSISTVATADTTDRMIAAILPHGDEAWFFKVVGPASAVDKAAREVADFLTTIRINNDDNQLTYRPSPTWKEMEGDEVRAAILIIPGDKPLELTVTRLPLSSDSAILDNVNRWRGQMQLPPIGENKLAETTSEIKAADDTMTVVDLKGHFQRAMTPPFAGRAPFEGGAPFAGSESAPLRANASAPELPAGHPPIGPGTSATAQSSSDLARSDVPSFDAPKSWQVLAAGGFRKAAFGVSDGPKQALVTLTEFSANSGPMITDPLENVNRWRREVGLALVDKDSLGTAIEEIKIGGQDATYTAAVPDPGKAEESQAAEATLAAMVRDGDHIWFFKMKGDRELVVAQQQNFRDFLKSVRFTADRGAIDVN